VCSSDLELDQALVVQAERETELMVEHASYQARKLP
jgi:hypothetical protein